MTRTQWWQLVLDNQAVLDTLIALYHPANGLTHRMPSSAPAAEEACKQVRKSYTVKPNFQHAVTTRDAAGVFDMLNAAWYGLPESLESRQVPGFHVLCDLCSEYEADEPNPVY